MNNSNELRAKLALPPINHIGVIVNHIDEAVEYYSSIFGLGPFTVYDFVPDKCWLWGEPIPLKLHMGKAMWGNIEFELIEPLGGESLHKSFLRTHGEGFHHLGFLVPNYDEMFNKFVNEGFEPLTWCDSYVETYRGYVKACYFDTRKVGGLIFEISTKSQLLEQ